MVEAMEVYKERIPGVKEKPTPFWVDEWVAGQGMGLRGTLGVAAALHEFFRHSEYVMMGAYTGFSGLYRYDDVDAVISSRGILFKLFIEHYGTIPVKISGNSPQKELIGTVGVDIPQEISGSPTYPLDIAAAIDESKSKVIISVVNPTATEQSINIKYDGANPRNDIKTYTLVSTNVNDDNTISSPDVIKVKESTMRFTNLIKVQPFSITLYEVSI